MPPVKTAVVIPSYRVAKHIKDVVLSLPPSIDHIIVVDDSCPEHSGNVAEDLDKNNLTVLYNERNLGVGGAVIAGYKKALELGCDLIVKMDGDGQMDPARLDSFVGPLVRNEADYTKGNRFRDFTQLKSMPKARVFGNSVLSFLVKLASGYWDIVDPTNGYTAIHRRALEKLNLEKISKCYFFESDMLIHLNLINAVVKDVEMPARYGAEESSLRIGRTLLQFPPRLLRGLVKRIALKYFIYDFNMASIYMLMGLPMFFFGVVFGAVKWIGSFSTGEATPLGTIMLAALPIILGLEMLLQAISIDINSVPKK